jgi:monoamine oxidase
VSRAGNHVDVVIIGAGLAGLSTAMQLVEAGCSVILLEGSERVGGRVHTRYEADLPGGMLDVGARQIGMGYTRTWGLIKRFGLVTVDETVTGLPTTFAVNGGLVSPADWEASPLNRLEPSHRHLAPTALGPGFLVRHDALGTRTDWLQPEFAYLDVAPIDLLRADNASDERIRLTELSMSAGSATNYSTLGLLQEHHRTMEEMRTTLGGSMPAAQTAAAQQAAAAAEASGIVRRPIQNIVGGTARLTEALAAVLGDAIRLASPARSIEFSPAKICVRTTDGAEFHANHVVSTIPFTMLRKIDIDVSLEPLVAEAINVMPYLPQTRMWARVTSPFWDQDGLPGSTFSDGAFGHCVVMHEPMSSDHVAMFILNGATARRFDGFGDAGPSMLVAALNEARPTTVGCLEPFASSSWETAPYARGLRHAYRPGDVGRFAPLLAMPHVGGRFHIAGEHTRREEFGMEAALESADRVVAQIVAGATPTRGHSSGRR